MSLNFPINFGLPLNLHFIFESAGFFFGYKYYQHLRKNSNDEISEINRLWLLFGACLGAFLGSRIVGSLEQPNGVFVTKQLLFYLFSSKTIIGGLIGGLVGVEMTKKIIREKNSSGDLITFPLILGMILGRIGCFTNGVHEPTFGLPTNSIFGMDLGDGIPRHPTELYEIVFLIGLWMLLKWMEKKVKLRPGVRFQFFMIAYFSFRFFISFIQPRIFVIGNLGTLQICCILVWAYYYKTIYQILYSPKKLYYSNI